MAVAGDAVYAEDVVAAFGDALLNCASTKPIPVGPLTVMLEFLTTPDILRLSSSCRRGLPLTELMVHTVCFQILVVSHVSIQAIAEHCLALASLNLGYCRNLTDVSIQAIAEHCPALTNLDVRWCTELTNASILAIAEHYPALRVITRRP